MEKKKEKVFVGLSGGVDSSVSAALLKEDGYDVTGVFIKTWHPDFLPCTWVEDRKDAMHVAAKLSIPFVTLDLEREYKQEVADYMIEEYRAGRTPNPDVMCNRYVKFGGFLQYALKEGADYVATGHYAQNIKTEDGFLLREGLDENKDQSYFLWTLTQDDLKHVLFPVGEIEKPKVRKLAEKFDLVTATKKDSQGICFLGKVNMRDFLKNYIDEIEGDVLSEDGDVVGRHEGAVFYTMGQRQGFTITEKTPHREPYYVVAKNIENNIVTVSHTPKESKHSLKEINLQNCNWVSGYKPTEGKYLARIRYRQTKQNCTLSYEEGVTKITFDEAQTGLSSGQSLVLYYDHNCLGGGVVA